VSTWLNVARSHLLYRQAWVYQPWLFLVLAFGINLVIFGAVPGDQGHPNYTGGIASIYVMLIIAGAVAVARQLPFALALGVSRRSFCAGSAAVAVGVAAVIGGCLTALQAIERVTGGWGTAGLLAFLTFQVVVAAAVVLVISFAHGWQSASNFFTTLTVEGLTGILALIALAFLAGGFATTRRATA
jgi:lysylphosphatidylglycerol synthetase-like protein (DUF2156 family)